MKADKSLQEVWKWKDKVYEETKGLSIKETTQKIHLEAEKAKKKYKLKLRKLNLAQKYS